jgi:hypothetical protein
MAACGDRAAAGTGHAQPQRPVHHSTRAGLHSGNPAHARPAVSLHLPS